MSISQTIRNIGEICVQHGVQQLVLSPGSRNAPLVLGLSRHPEIFTRIVPDERSAAYIALGMAQSSGYPTILLCTSGTAALNYGPAIAEAFYQKIPLLVFTADRPPEWIDQNDGQSIRQAEIFRSHVKKSFVLPVSFEHDDDRWYALRAINEAIVTTTSGNPGPVHVNIPFREPLYPEPGKLWHYDKNVPLIRNTTAEQRLSEEQWMQLEAQWSPASNILVVAGQMPYSESLSRSIELFTKQVKVPVIGDITANLHRVDAVIKHSELILGKSDKQLKLLKPDLLVTFGGGFVSKNLKSFLRKCRPARHWHLQHSNFPPDTFKSLTNVIGIRPADFFSRLSTQISNPTESSWYKRWHEQEASAKSFMGNFLQEHGFNELYVVKETLSKMGAVHLHLANSSAVRWVGWLGTDAKTIEISSNRGTSGIDGCSSTAVGHALINNHQNLLITGDMAFFYDRNAFWHQYKLPNLKILILNNHGGGIFRLIDGPNDQPELEEMFVTQQALTAKNTARDFGMNYLYCNCQNELGVKLDQLLAPNNHASILEMEFVSDMTEIYGELKAKLKE